MPEKLSASEAVARIAELPGKSGAIYVPGCAAEPTALVEAWRAAPEFADALRFTGVWIPGVNKVDYAGLSPQGMSETFFLSAELRGSFSEKKTRFAPLPYTEIYPMLGTRPLGAAVLHLSRPNADGVCSLGIAADFTPAVLHRDILKIGLLNEAMPFVENSPHVAMAELDIVVEDDTPLLTYDAGKRSSVFDKIAENICSLIDNGDVLQFGLGKIQLSVLEALSSAQNMRLHAGMISDPVLPLLDKGVISNAEQAITTGVALGEEELYKQVAADPRVHFQPVSYTHDIGTLRQLKNLVAINSVIEVDLFGQANAEWLNGQQISGAGGLVDFLRGARLASGGRAIIALPSTASKGTTSRIIPKLPNPASIARGDSLIVVTENGIADLRGVDIDTRADKLISIAHPDYQAQLAADWDEMRRQM